MPNVVGVSRRDNSVYACFLDKAKVRLVGKRFFFQDAANGCSAKVQSRSGQYLGDPHLSHGRAKGSKPLDNVADIIGVLVHGLDKLEEPIFGVGSSLCPVGNGFGFDHKSLGSFSEVPGTGGSEFQDGHPLLGRISRTSPTWQPGNARIFDPDFFAEQGVFVLNPVELASQPDPLDATIDGEAPGVRDCPVGQGNAVNDCLFDIFRPVLGKRNTSKCAQSAHRVPSETLWEKDGRRIA